MQRFLDLVDQCVVPVRGIQDGSGWYCGPDLVATSRHLLGDSTRIRVGSTMLSRESVHVLEGSDIAVIRVEERHEVWLLVAESWSPDERCHVRMRTTRRSDTAMVTVEGLREQDGYVDLKVSAGQIVPGFSGAPAVSHASGRVVGLVRRTRNRDLDLGGLLVPADQIRELVQSAEGAGAPGPTEIRRVSELWLDALGGHDVDTITWVPPNAALFGRELEMAELRRRASPGTTRFLVGVPGSGKSSLIAEWMATRSTDADGNSFNRYAYVPLQGYRLGNNPFLRALAYHLETLPDSEERRELAPDESRASVMLAIRKTLGAHPIGLAFDDGENLLVTTDGRRALAEVLDSGVLSWAAVIVSRWPGDGVPVVKARMRPDIEVNGLPVEGMSELLSREFSRPVETATDVAILLDVNQRLPGPLMSIRGDLEATSDIYQLTELIVNSAGSYSIDSVRTFLAEGSAIVRRQWLGLLSRIVSGENSPSIPQALKSMLQAIGWCTADALPTNLLFRNAPELLVAAVTSTSLDEDAITESLNHVAEHADRAALEILTTASWDIDTPSIHAFLIRARDRCARLSLNEPLGPVAEGPSISEPSHPGASLVTATEVLARSRRARTARDLLVWVAGVAEHRGLLLEPVDLQGFELVRRAFSEAEGRFGMESELTDARELLLESFQSVALESNGLIAPALIGLMCDSCRGLIARARFTDARRRLDEVERLLRHDASGISAEMRARLRITVITLRVLLGDEMPLDALAAAENARESGQIAGHDEMVLRSTLVDVCARRGLPMEVLKYELDRLLGLAALYPESDGRVAIVSRIIALVRSAGVQLAHDDRVGTLERCVELVDALEADAQLLATFGDARPLSAVCKVLLTLSRVLSRDGSAPGRRRARKLRSRAVAMLARAVDESPNATLWGLYLRAMDKFDPATLEQLNPSWYSKAEADSVDKLLIRYRKWSKSRTITSERELETELWIINRRWIRDGSVVTLARRGDDSWIYRRLEHKIRKIEQIYVQRTDVLNALERRWGGHSEISLERFRLEGQYQRAVVLYGDGAVNDEAVLSVIDSAMEQHGPLVRFRIARAEYLRYTGDLEGSISELRGIPDAPWSDGRVARKFRVGLARSLVDASVRLPDPDADAWCREALQLIGSLEESTTDAAVLALRARLELDSHSMPQAAEDLWKLFVTDHHPANAWTQGRAIFDLCSEILREEGAPHGLQLVAQQFANPRILLDFSSILLRWHVLLESPSGLGRVEAALTVSEGVRLLADQSSMTSRLPFLQGRALLLACEQTGSVRPLDWSRRTGGPDIDDLEYSRRRLHSAHSLSVGGLRSVIHSMLQRLADLQGQIS